MLKKYYRVVSLLLCCFAAMTSIALADEKIINQTEIVEGSRTYMDENGMEITETTQILSYDEALAVVMEKNGVSQSEAEMILCNNIESRSTARATTFVQRTVRSSDPGYEIELGGIWSVYNEGSFRQLNSLHTSWSGAVGSGNYTWSQLYLTDLSGSYPTTVGYLKTRGTAEVAVDTSVSGSYELKSSLLGMGFSASSSVGETIYYRKVIEITLRWDLYE